MSKAASTPTRQTYNELQHAYQHYNNILFAGRLPPCLITLQRKGARVMGYFSPTRFAHRSGKQKLDEIAMNPMHFRTRNDVEILQTLVHEMVHLWQAHFGKPSRGGYHNNEWATQMETIGLMPSSTGRPGGARTGQAMNDYPQTDGPFVQATNALLAKGFTLEWYEPSHAVGPSLGGAGIAAPAKPSAGGKRITFCCPECGAKAWGKAALKLLCGTCHVAFVAKKS